MFPAPSPAPPPDAARHAEGFGGRAEEAWVGGVGVSAAVHVALVFCLGAIWTWTVERDAAQPPEALLVTTAEPPAEVAPDAFEVAALPSDPVPDSAIAGGRAADEWLAEPAITAPLPPSPLSSRPSIATAMPGRGELAGRLTEVVGPLSGAGGFGGDGSGDGTGDGDGNGFFGRRHPDGKTFVYVVDCSSSMGAPHPSQWKTRLGRVKVELINSISTLSPERSFFVIFFNGQSHPMPATGLLEATPENQEKSLEWIVRVPPAGETDPRQALALALRLQPDIIYFLTDGAFTAEVRNELGRLKQRRSAIHTFAFGDRAGERTLEWIAKHNGGEYHFVP